MLLGKMVLNSNKTGVALLSLLFALTASAAEIKPVSKPALTVRTTQLKTENWSKSIAANGSILPWQEAIISAESAGLRIATINVNVGDSVKKGDVLATLASETVRANVAELRAAVQESEATLADAIANADRSNKLIAAGFLSAQQASQTNTSQQTARARLDIQKAKLDAAQIRLDQTTIVAPDSGIISASTAAVGSLTQNNTELFRVIRQGKLEWFAELTAEDLAQVKKGMPVSVTLADGQMIHGKVRAVSPSVNIQTRHGLAIVRFADDVNLVGGLFARGVFNVSGGTKAVQTLPQSALMQRGSQTFVLVVAADNRVHERKVSIGQRQANQVEIKSGLKATEPVVESGGAFLTEGDVVLVVKG